MRLKWSEPQRPIAGHLCGQCDLKPSFTPPHKGPGCVKPVHPTEEIKGPHLNVTSAKQLHCGFDHLAWEKKLPSNSLWASSPPGQVLTDSVVVSHYSIWRGGECLQVLPGWHSPRGQESSSSTVQFFSLLLQFCRERGKWLSEQVLCDPALAKVNK